MKNKYLKSKVCQKGVSLFEILVVIGIFAVLGILATRSIILTLRGAGKSESLVKVRESVDYSLAVMERQLRNAELIDPCPNIDQSTISYVDTAGNSASFSCRDVGQIEKTGYIASSSARITGEGINITSCSLVCSPSLSGALPSVAINIEAEDASQSGATAGKVSISTQVSLRSY